MIALEVNDLAVEAGGKTLLEGLSFVASSGDKIGVVGRNGAGKTTLLTVLGGDAPPLAGTVRRHGAAGYLHQDPRLKGEEVEHAGIEHILAGRDLVNVAARLEKARLALEESHADENVRRFSDLQERYTDLGGYDADAEIGAIPDGVGLPAGKLLLPVRALSGGERRRLELARILFAGSDMLLLDEPTNHLDAESVNWLEGHLRNYPGAILIVTHDRYFLDNVTGWILELDHGRGIPYEGNYTSWLHQKQKRLEQEAREDEARQRTLARESDWIASSPKARQAKSKARYERYEELLKIANAKTNQVAQITIPVAERLGQNVVDFEHLTKGFGDNLLIDDLTFKLPPGGIVGVIGPNGAGKTTLFRMITGQEKPDKGTIKIGESVRLGYVDQSRDSLDGKKTVWEEISEGNDMIALGKREVNSRAYCAAFNFKGADQQKKVGTLSGGERNRVHLAKMLRSGANLLLLDEPTNDLDVDTLRALEEALEDFAGCAVIISHDRWFLDRIATHILSFEGDSHVEWFEGNFQDYEADKMRRLGTDSVIPHRLKYKKFKR